MAFFRSFYLSKNTFILLGVCIALFSFGLLNNAFFGIGQILFALVWFVVLIETMLLYSKKKPMHIERKLPHKISNGDANRVTLQIKNELRYALQATIIEDLPEQFQYRKWERKTALPAQKSINFSYEVQPKLRGIYHWGNCHVLFQLSKFSLVYRKETFPFEQEVACFPSFEQFNRIPLKAIVSQFSESSEHTVRKIGQSLEFEQIKDYSSGDDYRHINWKASAKRGQLMLNQYQDERSQDIYCVLDLGRSMKMPFQEQTLLDYAVNGCLALSKAIIMAQDKAGFIGLSHQKCDFLPAKRDFKQFGKINEMLYNLKTDFLEANYEQLYKFVRLNIKQRSLLVIFTNFDSVNSMHRQLPYLKSLARHHLLLVVFFENTEIAKIIHEPATDLKDIYTKTIGNSFLLQNRLITKELQNFGIQSLYVQPQKLSLEVINQYLNLKRKQLL